MTETCGKGLRAHIHAGKKAEQPIGELAPEGEKETSMETALRMVDEVKRLHPDAEISVEVDV